MAGYSGTPLAKKLGIKPGANVVVLGAPRGYRALLDPLPDGVKFRARVTAAADVIHLFVDRKAKLEQQLHALLKSMRADVAVWVSWPKKASGMPTDITEDVIRAVALPLGLVDIKVCAVDDTWSGLKMVIRKSLR